MTLKKVKRKKVNEAKEKIEPTMDWETIESHIDELPYKTCKRIDHYTKRLPVAKIDGAFYEIISAWQVLANHTIAFILY